MGMCAVDGGVLGVGLVSSAVHNVLMSVFYSTAKLLPKGNNSNYRMRKYKINTTNTNIPNV